MISASASQLPLPASRWLSAAEAAGYVGVGEDEFRSEVSDGVWPAAGRTSAARGDLWDRVALDRQSDRLSGLDVPGAASAGADADAPLSVQEAAELACCSEDRIRRSSPEELPRYGKGRKLKFRRDDVVAFASSQHRAKPEATDLGVADLLAKHRGNR